MPGKFGLSESEYRIMSIIWEENREILFRDIYKIIIENGYTWTSQTVQTFLDKLVLKEALTFRWQGHKKSYYPTSSKTSYASKWMHRIFEENFDTMDEFILSFNKLSGQLSESQIKELKNIWDE